MRSFPAVDPHNQRWKIIERYVNKAKTSKVAADL
jgi:hypothetical protein